MKKRQIGLLLAMLMTLSMCSGVGYAASSPAWDAADPVVCYMDIDNVGSASHFNNTLGWQPGGAYQAEYTYDASAAKTGYDGSKYLRVSKNEDGVIAHRGDLRVKFYMEAVAGDFDFFVDNTSSTSNIAFKCNLNLQDKTNTDIQAETTLVQVSGDSLKLADNSTASVTNGMWYRARYVVNKTDMTVQVLIHQLKEDGTLGTLVKQSEPVALNQSNASGSLSENWQVQRYTVELYGAPGVVCGFDNFVLYSEPVNTASFQVGQGGQVTLGQNSISASDKGLAKEVAVGTEEELSFGIVPEQGYELASVTVGGEDKTSLFTGTEAVSVGKLDGDTEINVSFTSQQTPQTGAVGSPAWGKKSPVVDIIDFDTYTDTWSKAGAALDHYSYDGEAVKTSGDKSKFLQLTKTTGPSGERGDCRVTFANGQTAVAGSMDFIIKKDSVQEHYLAKIMLNLTDGATQKESAVLLIKSEQVLFGTQETAVQNDAWYRIYYELDKNNDTMDVFVYSLDEQGHISDLVVSKTGIALTVDELGDSWYVNRYTIEMYSKEGSGIGFDNFVLYDRPVEFVSYQVGQGGKVSFGQDQEITAGNAGFYSEVAAASGEDLAFAVAPEGEYEVSKVMVGTQDMTSQFSQTTSAVSVGKVTEPLKVQVEFETDVPKAPVISNGTIEGSMVLNSLLTVKYDFLDENQDSEDTAKTEVVWERSLDGETDWQTIANASGQTYQLTQSDVKHYIRAKIKAYSQNEPYESNQITTAAYGPVSGNLYEISSPAWRVAPVLRTIDFDTDAAGWSKAGAYLDTMDYNGEAVKEGGDGSQYLEITRTSGAAGQRADLRVTFGKQSGVVYDFDFKVKGVAGDNQGLGLVNLNLTDGAVTAPETRLVSIKGTTFGDTPIQSDTWYRVRVTIHRDAEAATFDYELFALDDEGKLSSSLYSRLGNALNLTGLSEDWYMNRFTVEMYGAPNSQIAFDNFVAYSADVHTATFDVGEGGRVEIGDNEITAEDKGVASEAAVSAQESLVFAAVPDEGYTLRSVTINGVDRTEWFANGEMADIGPLSDQCRIEVSFQNDQPTAPVISDLVISGLGVVGSELSCQYDFYDANFDTEDKAGAEIKWQRSSDGQTGWTDIPGANGATYVITESDNNQYLRVIVKAKASQEPFYSNELVSNAFAVGSKNFYVATDGSDENDGSLEHPFATLTAARDAIREGRANGTLPSGNIVVNIRGGHYPVSQQMIFEAQDSGVEGSPIIYQAYGDETVVFEGGQEIEASKAVKVTDQAILDRVLDETARGKLMMIDLGAEGIDVPDLISYGHAVNSGWRPLEVYINGAALEKSVWPNANSETGKYLRTTSAVLEGTDNREGPFTIGYPDPEGHTKLWSEEAISDLMIGGFLSNDFSCQHLQVESLDADALTLLTKEGSSYAPAADRRFYFWNLIEEIDQPGESYIDRENDIVYFYPAVDMTDAEIVVSTMQDKMLVVNQASHITFRNLEFEFTRETVAEVAGSHITFDGCTLAHTSGTGIKASGTNITIENCNIYDCGYGGIDISGGDRVNLVSSENVIHNNRIHDNGRVKETYSPAINVAGMGVTMTHNELYNNASQIIGMTGNDHLIAYNNIYDSVLESADQGAVYWGRNPSELGIRIMYNYFHDMENDYGGYGHQAVFWDDGAYGPFVYGNVFFRSSNTKDTGDPARTNALKTNGGAFSHIENNIFIDGANAFNPHKWNNGTKAYGWWLFMYDKFDQRYNPVYEDKMLAVPVNGEEWTNYYSDFQWTDENGKVFSTDLWSHLSPYFNQTFADAMKDKDRLTDQDFLYAYAQENGPSFGNVFQGNVCVDISQAVFANSGQATETNTYSTSSHDIFQDYDGRNFALTEAGLRLVQSRIPGFENVPFDDMGLVSAVGGTLPSAGNVMILGESGTGDTVKLSYTYQSQDGVQQGVSRFQWYLADSEDGTYQKIGYRDSQLTIQQEYKNKYLKCEVTPVSRNGLEGEPVMSDPILVGKTASADETLQDLIQQAQDRLDQTTVGETFGCVPAGVAQALSDALAEAKETDLEDTDAVYSAIDLLNHAISSFLAGVITTLPDPITTSETYNVEPYMGDLTFHIAQGNSGVSITLPTGTALQEIQANGFITADGVSVPTSFTIQKGTVITAPGKDSVTVRLFGDDTTPSQTIALAKEGTLTAIHASDDVLTLSLPAVYQFDGIDTRKIAGAISSKYSTIHNEIDSVDDMGDNVYGRLRLSNGFGIAAKELKELVLYNVTTETPVSPDPSPVVTPPPVNSNTGNGGFVSVGGVGTGGNNQANANQNPFTDMTSHWAKDDILALYQKGIVAGVTATTFEPDREITRAEFAALMVRALNISAPGEMTFTDVAEGAWYAESIKIAAYAGLIQGYEGQFRPEDTITREEMAVVIAKGYQFLGHTAEKGAINRFTDQSEIAGWARDSVDIAATAGIISGMDDGRFAPGENATRAQASSMIQRLLAQ